MQEFFKSVRFKILAALLVVVFAFMLRAAQSGTAIPMLSSVTGALLTPIQRATAGVTHAVREAFGDYLSAPAIAEENDALRQEIAALREQLVELERYKSENEQLRDALFMTESQPNFKVEPAIVIGRDAADRFYSFTIDKGSRDGVSKNDPVVTGEGVVGIVSDVGTTHAKVITLLDATLEVGAMDVFSREIGVTGSTLELAQEGKLKLSYLPRDCLAAPGDLVVTTGVGGLFPAELVIGTIEELKNDGQGLSLYAVIQPQQDIRTLHDVLVITQFEGQGG